MKIMTNYSPDAYISGLKENMGGHFQLGMDRFTGFFFGHVFTVTHHSEFTWNRRITNEKNTAFGYVCRSDDGCQVRFLYVKGLLAPPQFLLYLALVSAIYLIPLFMSGAFSPALLGIMVLVSLVTTGIAAVVSAIAESFTEESEAGRKYLFSMLLDPNDPYENIHKV